MGDVRVVPGRPVVVSRNPVHDPLGKPRLTLPVVVLDVLELNTVRQAPLQGGLCGGQRLGVLEQAQALHECGNKHTVSRVAVSHHLLQLLVVHPTEAHLSYQRCKLLLANPRGPDVVPDGRVEYPFITDAQRLQSAIYPAT
jgi:hypothetical protein